ncbi:hypothetical protein AMJ85_08770, partial [candidate division BRC1 bacterium SM23_51]
MILTIDVGNTHTSVALFEQTELRHHWMLATVLHRTSDEYLVTLDRLLDVDRIERAALTGAIVGSVVPPLTST